MPDPTYLTLQLGGGPPLIQADSDGNIFVRGEKVDSNLRVYDAFKEFLSIGSRPKPGKKRLVYVETPFAPAHGRTVEDHLAYARAAMKDCLHRGEAPWASHLIYNQPGVLDDTVPDERTLGLEAGFAWGLKADATVVYEDLGLSRGMDLGISRAREVGRPVEFRKLPGWVLQ